MNAEIQMVDQKMETNVSCTYYIWVCSSCQQTWWLRPSAMSDRVVPDEAFIAGRTEITVARYSRSGTA